MVSPLHFFPRSPDNIANSVDPVPQDAGLFKHCHRVQFYDGKMYAFGGTNNTDYTFDVATGQWARLGAWFTPRAHFACAMVHGQIYVVGGQYYRRGAFEVHASVERFDLAQTAAADRRWIPAAPMHEARTGHAVAVLRDARRVGGAAGGPTVHALYAVGGFGADGKTPLASAERYDLTLTRWDEIDAFGDAKGYAIEKDAWVEVAPMNQARYGCGLAVLKGIVYALGGYHPALGALPSVETYDEVFDHWTMLTAASALPAARFGFRTAVASGNLFVLGGYDHRSQPTATVWRFAQTGHRMPGSRAWSTFKNAEGVADLAGSGDWTAADAELPAAGGMFGAGVQGGRYVYAVAVGASAGVHKMDASA